MKEVTNSKIIKSFNENDDVDEIAQINKYTRRQVSEDEIYRFSIVLCDNEIDRDYERFCVKSLHEMASLFQGKTGVFDHSMKGKDQTARIFKTSVEQDPTKTTSIGEPYTALVARAYMPKTEKNAWLIEEIETGIKKEVSVGCSVKKTVCSICSQDWKNGSCVHRKGNEYSGKMCYGVLSDVVDAYEWSFVAVPAQPMAGVIKAFKEESEVSKNMEDVLNKILKSCSKDDASKLKSYIETLENNAEQINQYKSILRKDVEKMSALVMPEMSSDEFANITKKLDISELESLKNAFEKQKAKIIPPIVQLDSHKKEINIDNSEFKI